jgi:hypothetical protein
MTSAPCDHIAQAALRICNAKMQSMIYTLITIWLLVNLLVFFLLIINRNAACPAFPIASCFWL